MKKGLRSGFSLLAIVFTFAFTAFAQETTGSIEITAKDAANAVIPNVAITVAASGNSAGFKRTATTNDDGFARILQVPPGTYTVSSAAVSGFVAKTLSEVTVSLGNATIINFELSTTLAENVTVTADDVSPVDTSSTKIQTTISAATAELLPKGISFSSILKVSPATRVEPLGGGFQIDGASGAENVFVIDGQEVTNVRTGTLDGNSDLPFSLVQEVQIKSSGFEAEYGGATGGVINVVTKGGGNQFRGEFGSQWRRGDLQARGRPILFIENSTNRPNYLKPGRDNFLGSFPGFSVGGPILKDRVWFFTSYTPQIFDRQRVIEYVNPNTLQKTGIAAEYRSKATYEYDFVKINAQPFSKLSVNASYIYNPLVIDGNIPGYSTQLNTSLPRGNGLVGPDYLNQRGGRDNSTSVAGQAVWTPRSNLVLGFRAGHYFYNEKFGSYGVGDVTQARTACTSVSSAVTFPLGFGCIRNTNNGLDIVTNTLFDVTVRNTFDADATILFNGGGRHELKGGFQYNGVSNDLLSQQRDNISLRWGATVSSVSGRAITSSPNARGAGTLVQFREQGNVSSKNEAIYLQDKWQPTNRLTLNLGVRTERENVPSFNGLGGIGFDFQDKIAPRLGAAFDLTGDGKTKVSAFYGWFYDRFKYELPRGSFGGQFFHTFYFELFDGDTLATITPATIFGSGSAVIGGLCPENTPSTTPIFGRVRCDVDARVPSNSGLGAEFGAIDPNIKAFRQSELTFTFERDLGRNFSITGRYSRKNVDHAVEDAGFLTSTGSEGYIIGNPGEGLYKSIAEANGLIAPKPQRLYQALEVSLNKRLSNNFFFNVNYTYSRLYGNYSGLASSDEDGRLSPNVNRFFDLPHAGFTVAGGPDNGLLPTDRPHVAKFFGAYNLDWKSFMDLPGRNETSFQVFSTIQSGTPLTTLVDILSIDTIPLTKRGDLGRTETFTQTDFAIRHRLRFGKDSRYTLVFEADGINVFNEANELSRFNLISITNFSLIDPRFGLVSAAESVLPNANLLAVSRFQRTGAPLLAQVVTNTGIYNPNPPTSDQPIYPAYNYPNSYQTGREIRLGFRFIF